MTDTLNIRKRKIYKRRRDGQVAQGAGTSSRVSGSSNNSGGESFDYSILAPYALRSELHSHFNKGLLDLLSMNGSYLLYNGNGLFVDNADKLGGVPAIDYALKTDLHTHDNKTTLDSLSFDGNYLEQNGGEVWVANADRLGNVTADNYWQKTELVNDNLYLKISGQKIKAGYADLSYDANQLGGIAAADYFNKYNADLPTVDWEMADALVNGTFRTKNFAPGTIGGVGAQIDQAGHAEMQSLILREFLRTPELIKNRVSVANNEFWFTDPGIIEDVSGTGPYTITYKIEEGDGVTHKVDDILIGIFNDGNGFETAYFDVVSVDLVNNQAVLNSRNGIAPSKYMVLARKGNETDTTRQTSVFVDGLNGYLRVLGDVNDHNTDFSNIITQIGYLNMHSAVFGDMDKGIYVKDNGYFENVKVSGEIHVTGGNAETLTGSQAKADAAQLAATGVADLAQEKADSAYNLADLKITEADAVTITHREIKAPYIATLGLTVGDEILMGPNAVISWDKVIGTENVESITGSQAKADAAENAAKNASVTKEDFYFNLHYRSVVILLIPYYDGTILNESEIIGQLTFRRGGTSASNRTERIDIAAKSAYIATDYSMSKIQLSWNWRFVKCQYNGKWWLALQSGDNVQDARWEFWGERTFGNNSGYSQSDQLKVISYRKDNDPVGGNGILNTEVNNSISYLTATSVLDANGNSLPNENRVTTITRDTITAPFIQGLSLKVGDEILMGKNAIISWDKVTGTENVESITGSQDKADAAENAAKNASVTKEAFYLSGHYRSAVIFLIPYYDGVILNESEVIGQLTFRRGGTSASNRTERIDIAVKSAYNTTHYSMSKIQLSWNWRFVKCQYNGKWWLALQSGSNVQDVRWEFWGKRTFGNNSGYSQSDQFKHVLYRKDGDPGGGNGIINAEINNSISYLTATSVLDANGNSLPNESRVTTITNDTISTTNVIADSLQVRAANIIDQLTAAQINFDNATGNNVNLTGHIEAETGNIGIWDIVGDALQSEDGVVQIIGTSGQARIEIVTTYDDYLGNDKTSYAKVDKDGFMFHGRGNYDSNVVNHYNVAACGVQVFTEAKHDSNRDVVVGVYARAKNYSTDGIAYAIFSDGIMWARGIEDYTQDHSLTGTSSSSPYELDLDSYSYFSLRSGSGTQYIKAPSIRSGRTIKIFNRDNNRNLVLMNSLTHSVAFTIPGGYCLTIKSDQFTKYNNGSALSRNGDWIIESLYDNNFNY